MNALASAPAPGLRAMRLEDLDRVMQVERSAYEFGWTRTIFRDCLMNGHGCWVLVLEEEIIGHGVLATGAGEAHILNVCVAPAHQQHGHGRYLVRRLLDLARWHRAERVFLEVRPSNPRAIRLYERIGFNEIGRRPRYYPAGKDREDAIVMALELLGPEGD